MSSVSGVSRPGLCWRRLLTPRTVLLVAGLTGALWFGGLPVRYALALALVGPPMLVLVEAVRQARDPVWPERPDDTDDGRRLEFAALTWTFIGLRNEVSEAAVRRLRAVATGRLARLGIDLGADAGAVRAEELLGDRAWRTLGNAGGNLPRLSDIEHCVGVLERLLDAPDRVPASPRTE